MQRLFRSFERFGLDYLLISGQASILYGAATFSEDVDLWIRPEEENAARLTRALAACRARIHKLTPPPTRRHLRFGHGFHFVLPGPPETVFLDVMGVPPRVGAYGAARRRARLFRSPWGSLPVVSIPDLVLLKKTRRFADYEVISNLAAIAVSADPSRATLTWAASNTFRPEDRADFLSRLGRRRSLPECRRAIAREVQALQTKDASYWARIIRDLRKLRRSGGLLPEGLPVRKLIEE